MSGSHASFSTADIRFPLPLKITTICGCVLNGLKQMFSGQKRQMCVDLPIPSHPFLKCCTSFCAILRTPRGTGQCLIVDGGYNNPISLRSKISLPQNALAFHEVLHTISQVFRKMLP